MSERHTGLNSYVLRTRTGEYIHDPARLYCGYDRDGAHMWLWEPEQLADRVAEASKQMRWAGPLTAVRSRP